MTKEGNWYYGLYYLKYISSADQDINPLRWEVVISVKSQTILLFGRKMKIYIYLNLSPH